MKANIRSAMEQILDTADDTGETAKLATNFKDILNVIDGAGAINMEGSLRESS